MNTTNNTTTLKNLEANKIISELNYLYNRLNYDDVYDVNIRHHFKYIINDDKEYLFMDYNLLWSSDDTLPMRIIASSYKRHIINALQELKIEF